MTVIELSGTTCPAVRSVTGQIKNAVALANSPLQDFVPIKLIHLATDTSFALRISNFGSILSTCKPLI